MTIKNLYPPLRPTLDLNFAKTKRLDPRVTFSRASIGTYYGANGLVQTAVADQPRFDYNPTTGESLGLLIEESRANLITQSSDFSVWGTNPPTNNIVALNAAIAPDGTLSACEVGLTLYGGLTRNLSLTSGTIYTVSVWMKAKPGATYSAGSATVGANNNTTTSYASQLNSTSAWFRATHTFTAAATGVQEIFFGRSNGGGVNANFYAWGPQIEVGSFATSYIPTLASSVTRSADVASITGTNFSSWYRQDEGSVFADITDLGYPANIQGSLWKIFASTSHVSGRNAISLYRYSGGTLPEARFGIVDQNAATVVDLNTPTSPTRARVKSAIGLKSASYAATSHGNTAVTSSTAVPPTYVAADTLAFGQATNSTSQAKSCLISRLTYWPTRLSDATLQALTQ